MWQSPGSDIVTGERASDTGTLIQWLVAAAVSPIFGYMSNHFSTRLLLAFAVGTAVLANIFLLLAPYGLAFAYISFVLTGLSFGMRFLVHLPRGSGLMVPLLLCAGVDFVASLAYYSRTTAANFIIAPLLAFYFFTLTFSDMLTRLLDAFLREGWVQPNWVSHTLFQLAVLGFTFFIVVFGFREQRLRRGTLES